MNRRNFLYGSAAALAALGGTATLLGMGSSNQALAETFEVTKTEAEWRALLDDKQFAVLRQEDTEYPGSSPLLHEKRKGNFTCAGCDLPLYSSETKFESGTGWPSFWDALPNAVGTESRRHAVHDAHRSALPPLRRASRPRLRRRPAADRQTPLHQRRGAELQAGDRMKRSGRHGEACLSADAAPESSLTRAPGRRRASR